MIPQFLIILPSIIIISLTLPFFSKTPTGLSKDNLFAMRLMIQTPNRALIPSVVTNNGSQIVLVSKNQALIYHCQSLQNCNSDYKKLSLDSTILTDVSVSQNFNAIVTASETGMLNFYWQKTLGSYEKVISFKYSGQLISAVRMFSDGDLVLAGGFDRTVRVYQFNLTDPSRYSQTNFSLIFADRIYDIATNSIARLKNYIFVANGKKVSVFSATLSLGINPNFTKQYDLDWNKGEVAAVDSLADSNGLNQSIVAVGGKLQDLAIYQYSTLTKRHEIIFKDTLSSPILCLGLSPGGKYLVVGKNDNENRIYQQYFEGQAVKYRFLQPIILGKTSTYVRSVKFAMNGQAFVEARDDFAIRTYTIGPCPSGTTLTDGICVADSHILMISLIVFGVVVFVVILVIVCKKIRRGPAEASNIAFLEADDGSWEENDKKKKEGQVKEKWKVKSPVETEGKGIGDSGKSRANDAIIAFVRGDLE